MWLIPYLHYCLLQEAAALQRDGKAIPDRVLVPLVAKRLFEEDCVQNGYVLHGFPTTRTQAVELQGAGVLPNHVLLLDGEPNLSQERAKGRVTDPETGAVYHSVFGPPPSDITDRCVAKPMLDLDDALAAYARRKDEICSSYRTALVRLDADKPSEDLVEDAWTAVCTTRESNAPYTPRMILVGPPGAGKSIQAQLMAQKYDMVNVSAEELLRKAVASGSKIGASVKLCLQQRVPVPDAIAFSLVRERLEQFDCQTQGWVLSGFPNTLAQAQLLEQSGLGTDRVFLLDIPAAVVQTRLTERRIDPVTGRHYHLLSNPPPVVARDRLVTHPMDETSAVTERYNNYTNHEQSLKEFYKNIVLINADQEPQTVFEILDQKLIFPISSAP